MTLRYFKTQSPTVLAAHQAIEQQKKELFKQAKNFEEQFDGEAVYSHSVTGYGFCGLRLHNFNDRPDNHLWTKPMKQNGFVSHPRGKASKADDKASLEKLNNNYMRLTPEIREVKYSPFYDAIGTDWGAVMFNGIVFFEYDGFVYISTKLMLNWRPGLMERSEGIIEIVGSEYAAAEAAFKQGGAA